MKQKIKQRSVQLEQEIIDLKDVIEGKDRELAKSKRAHDRLKRELKMMKEEISILGGGNNNYQSDNDQPKKLIRASSNRSKSRKLVSSASIYQSPRRHCQSESEQHHESQPLKSSYQSYIKGQQRSARATSSQQSHSHSQSQLK